MRAFFPLLLAGLAGLGAASAAAPAGPTAPPRGQAPWERGFLDTVDDVLGDFEFDLKNGEPKGLKAVSIREVALSEGIPSSFRAHLEGLLTERILRATQAKVIQCLACRARSTGLTDEGMTVRSARANPSELARIARAAGIRQFMDAVFSYQPSGITLSMTMSDPETGEVAWSRSYNSETSRAAARRRGFEFGAGDGVRRITEYAPTLQYRGTVGYLFEPNLSGTTGCMMFGFRMVERYGNRKKEVGFEADYLRDTATLGPGASATETLYTGFNATLVFVHGWNLIGDEENFNRVRANFTAGVGGTFTGGYLGALLRGTWEWRLGKHFAVNAMAGYRPESTAFIGEAGKSVSGAELGFGISLLK